MKFGERKSYNKGDRVWVKGQRNVGVATITALLPFRRDASGVTLRGTVYTLHFDMDGKAVGVFYAASLKPATEAESQRSKDAAVDAHIKTLRASQDG